MNDSRRHVLVALDGIIFFCAVLGGGSMGVNPLLGNLLIACALLALAAQMFIVGGLGR